MTSRTHAGGSEAVAVEGHVVVHVLRDLRLLVTQATHGAGGAGVLLAATLGLNWRKHAMLMNTICDGFFFFHFSFITSCKSWES